MFQKQTPETPPKIPNITPKDQGILPAGEWFIYKSAKSMGHLNHSNDLTATSPWMMVSKVNNPLCP